MFVTVFLTCQHLAWLRVSCQHLLIFTSGDFNQRWVGNCTGLRVWSNEVSLAECRKLSRALVLMDNDREVSISVPAGSERRADGHALVCEAELQDMSSHATDSFSPSLVRKFLPITYQGLRAGLPQAVSISHPASIPGLFSLCWITGVSSEPAQP